MRYDAYEKKIKKVASVFKIIIHNLVKIIIAIALLVVLITALVVAKGWVMSAKCSDTVVYGTEPEVKAVAFLSKTHFEHCGADGEWEDGLPIEVGEYKIRAAAKTSFGGERYSGEMSFTVQPRTIDIGFASDAVEYGEAPLLSAALAYGDKIVCEKFDFGDYVLSEKTGNITSTVIPVKDSIRIIGIDGNDVTSSYVINVAKKDLNITQRSLEVTVSDKSAVYNGVALTYDGYEISGGELAYEDDLLAVFNASLIHVGSVDNTPELNVINKDGKLVTELYAIKTKVGKLTVTPKPLVISTQSDSFEYNAEWHSKVDHTVSSDTPLVSGHILTLASKTEIMDVGEKDNILGFTISDKGNADVTFDYSIFIDAGKLTVTPRPVTVTTQSDAITYDGEEHIYSQIEVSGIAGNDTYENESFKVLIAGSYTNKTEVTFKNPAGRDISANYTVTYNNGTVVVNKRSVVIIPASEKWEYDGEAHVCYSFTYAQGSMELVKWHETEVLGLTAITDVGTAVNRFDGIRIYDPNAKNDMIDRTDVTPNYDITLLDGGLLEITPRPITVAPADVEAVYDDELHIAENITVVGGSLLEGHELVEYTVSGSRVYPGESVSRVVTLPKVIDENENDITHNYDIRTETGIILIHERPISIIPDTVSKVYDGIPLVPEKANIAKESPYPLIKGHTLVSVNVGGSQIDAGTSNSYAFGAVIKNAKGENITEYYDITYLDGTLRVDRRPISIKPVYAERVYDGTPLMAFDWEYKSNTVYQLVAGETIYSIIYTGSQTDVGTSSSGIADDSVFIQKADGSESTGNYIVSFGNDELRVTHRSITVTVDYSKKVYDGKNTAECPAVAVVGSFAEDQFGFLTVTVKSAYVGIYTPDIIKDSLVIYDIEGDNVIDNYNPTVIDNRDAKLEIIKREVILRPADETKVYDGMPLYASKVVCDKSSPYELVDGHAALAVFTGEQTEVGKSPSDIVEGSVIIYTIGDPQQTPLNENYDIIKLTNGSLTVTDKQGGGSGVGMGGGGDLSGDLAGDYVDPELLKAILCYRIKSSNSATLYLKLKSFGDYSGTGWYDAEEYGRMLGGRYGADYLTGSALYDVSPKNFVEIESLNGQYALPYYLVRDESGNVWYEIQKSDVLYQGDASVVYRLNYSDFDWDAEYKLSDPVANKYEQSYRKHVYAQYLEIDDETREYMLRVIDEHGLKGNTTEETIFAVMNYMRNDAATYNLKYDRGLDEAHNTAIAFLDVYKEGVCRHFATAATLMYRSLGIPARYTVGFLADASKANEWCDVTADTAHAWVEVYLDGIGWVQLEVTGGGFGDGTGDGEVDPETETIEIVPKYQYKIYDGIALDAKNEIEGNMTFVELLKNNYTYEVIVSGSQLEIGCGKSVITNFVLYDPDGNDVTSDFDINYMDGVLEVIPEEIVLVEVQLYQLQKYYNGRPLYYEDEDYRILTEFKNEKVELELNISLTDVGILSFSTLNQNVNRYARLTVYNEKGQDISYAYRVMFVPYGESDNAVIIDPRYIEITTASQEKEYDGKPLTNDGYYITKGSLVSGHTLKAEIDGEITDVGEVDNSMTGCSIVDADGKSVYKNYRITVVMGVLTVSPKVE